MCALVTRSSWQRRQHCNQNSERERDLRAVALDVLLAADKKGLDSDIQLCDHAVVLQCLTCRVTGLLELPRLW